MLQQSPKTLDQVFLEGIADDLDPVVGGDAYADFQAKYFDDLAGFARDCIRWPKDGLTEYQETAAKTLVDKRRFSMRGPHGLGKTAFLAITVLWFALTRDGKDWKIPTLASAWRQLSKYLWPEIHKWARMINWDLVGRDPFSDRKELLVLSLKLSTGEAFALASDNPAFVEGAHADHILYIFDESKAIPPATWDAVEGALSAGNAYMMAASTPGEPNGRFYEIHSKKRGYEDWATMHVTLQMAIDAGQIDPEWAAKRLTQWGLKSQAYQNRVLGNFASSTDDTVITLAMVEAANKRWHAINDAGTWGLLESTGVDVGRGGDPSCEALRYGMAIKELIYSLERDVMQVAGRTAGKMRSNNQVTSVIDVIGIGAGVVDRLREMDDIRARVFAFVAGAKSDMMDISGELGFSDLRSAAWWHLRQLLMDGKIALPPDDKLTGDLTSPRYDYLSGGKIKVESKKNIYKRLGRSTDAGDAVAMVFMRDFVGGIADLSGLGTVEDFISPWA